MLLHLLKKISRYSKLKFKETTIVLKGHCLQKKKKVARLILSVAIEKIILL